MESEPNRTNQEARNMKTVLVTVAASLGLGLVFDLLFFGKIAGVSFLIYTLLTISALLLVARFKRHNLPKPALLVIPLLIFFSSMVFIRAGELLSFLNVVTTLYLLGLFVTLAARPDLPNYDFKSYLSLMVNLPLQVLQKARLEVSSLVASRRFLAKHQVLPQVVRGVFIALPVLILFVILFSSADLVFRHYVTDIFSFHVNGELFWRTVFILAVAFAFVGLFGSLGEKAKTVVQKLQKSKTGRYGLVEATVLFGSLNVLFFLFIAVQLTYLFGGATNIADGFTYAEYARKGFFELIAVAGLSLLVIFATERSLLREGQKHAQRFKLLSGALIVQVMIVMVSALKRLHLYEGAYGFTVLRLYSYIFMIWLAITLCILLYKIFADKRESTLAFVVFASTLLLFVCVNTLNVDSFVARKNVDRYEVTGKLDVRYIGSLGDDAVPQIARLLDSRDPKVREAVAASLYHRQQFLKRNDTWQSTNLSRNKALRIMSDHKQVLEQNKDKGTTSDYWFANPE